MNGDLTIKDEFLKVCEELRLREQATTFSLDECDYNTVEMISLRRKADALRKLALGGMVKRSELSELTIKKWKKELEPTPELEKLPSPYEMMKERWASID